MNITNVEFIRSAVDMAGFPKDTARRVVFSGRSNVGKSSTMNCIFQRKNLVRVSSMPGKTVFVNLFQVDKKYWFIDLPGYGYAKTSKDERQRFSILIEDFLSQDIDKIARYYIIVDARHKPTEQDVQMVGWVRTYNLPLTVIANKVDKLKPREVEANIEVIKDCLGLGEHDTIICFSAEKATGRTELVADISKALEG